MPRARSRTSLSAILASSWAARTSSVASAVSAPASSRSRARPRSTASPTSRAWGSVVEVSLDPAAVRRVGRDGGGASGLGPRRGTLELPACRAEQCAEQRDLDADEAVHDPRRRQQRDHPDRKRAGKLDRVVEGIAVPEEVGVGNCPVPERCRHARERNRPDGHSGDEENDPGGQQEQQVQGARATPAPSETSSPEAPPPSVRSAESRPSGRRRATAPRAPAPPTGAPVPRRRARARG